MKYILKSFIKHIILYFVKFATFLYPYNFHKFVSSCRDILYSKWLIYQMPNVSGTSVIGRHSFVIGKKYIKIGKASYIGKNAVLTAWDCYKPTGQNFSPQIVIGNEVNIGDFCHITAVNKIIIEDGVLTGRRVTITDNSHGIFIEGELKMRPVERPLYSKGEVFIGRNVWIGDKVTILPGIHIGEGSIIAANTVVTKNVPSFSVCAGNPGKIVKVL